MFKKIIIGLSHDDELKARLIINIQGIIMYLIAMVVFVFIMYMIVKPIPIVYYSVSTGRCVSVFIEGERCDCSQLPEKYEVVWIK